MIGKEMRIRVHQKAGAVGVSGSRFSTSFSQSGATSSLDVDK